MLACAKIFMASAATALNRLGLVMVGAVGQVIRITGGTSSGWMSSMVMVSFGDWVIWPSARVFVLDRGSRSNPVGFLARREVPAPGGPLFVCDLESAATCEQTAGE